MKIKTFILGSLATRAQRWRAALLSSAFLLTGFLLWESLSLGYNEDHTAIVALWLLAFAAYLLAVAPAARPPRDWRMWWRIHARTATLVVAITLLAFGLRVWNLGGIPFAFSGDEASFALEALRVLRGEIGTPFATGFLSQPTMSFYYGSLGIALFGATPAGARLPWTVLGVLTVPVIFWITKRAAGKPVAFAATVLLATYHFHIHYARLSLNNIADPLILGLALLFWDRATARGDAREWALLGAMCGLALYSYQGARLTPLVIAATIAYRLAQERVAWWRAHRRGLLIALGAFLIVAAPMLQFAAFYPDEFNARVNQMGILQSGMLEQATRQADTHPALILFDQFVRAALAFNFYTDRVVWYGLTTPLLDPIFGIVFLLGLGYATVRVFLPPGNRRLFPFVVWWWGATILGGALTESPPSSMRLVTLTAPTCVLIALGLFRILGLARQAFVKFPTRGVVLGVLAVFAVISLRTYFVDYTPRRIYGSVRAEAATALAPVLRDLRATHKFYFLGPPYMYWGFATLPYLVPDADAYDVMVPLTAPAPADWVPDDKGAVFIAVPERMNELRFAQATFADGQHRLFVSPAGYTLAALYIVER